MPQLLDKIFHSKMPFSWLGCCTAFFNPLQMRREPIKKLLTKVFCEEMPFSSPGLFVADFELGEVFRYPLETQRTH